MYTKFGKLTVFLAIFSLSSVIFMLTVSAAGNLPLETAASSMALSAGFFQFNNLQIFKGPVVDEPPASIDVTQKNENSCVIYENGKTDQATPCVFTGSQDNSYTVLIDEGTTLLGNNQEPALLSDFLAGDHINVLGWLSADSKTIRASVITDLESKNFHQSFSGTIKNVNTDGFTLVLSDGSEITVKTPIVDGAQITIKGIFDKVSNSISDVLSIFVNPLVSTSTAGQATPSNTGPVTPNKPSTLFKNFLKVFGL